MGYRNYIGYIPKKEYNKIKKLTREEFYTLKGQDLDYGYVSFNDFGTQLYNFGKYCDFETDGYVKPFFKDKEHQSYYESDFELYVVTKQEFLEKIIENYEQKIKNHYESMVNPLWKKNNGFIKTVKYFYDDEFNPQYSFDFSNITIEEQTALMEMMNHIRSNMMEWTCLTPYELNKGDQISESWKYEYAIFELVRIYKSFDWKKNVMVYYGW